MRVPDNKMALPPGISVWSSITYSEAEFRVAVLPANIKSDASLPVCRASSLLWVAVPRMLVLEPTTIAVACDARLICVSDMVDVGASGVCSSGTYPEEESGVSVTPLSVSVGAFLLVEADNPTEDWC